jgi:hypothetical protein
MNIAAICFLGGILLVVKIIIHCWLLYKIGRFKWVTSPNDLSRLQFVAPISFNVPNEFKEFKIAANILYAVSIVCFVIFTIGTLFFNES